jgi:hypothetical protein
MLRQKVSIEEWRRTAGPQWIHVHVGETTVQVDHGRNSLAGTCRSATIVHKISKAAETLLDTPSASVQFSNGNNTRFKGAWRLLTASAVEPAPPTYSNSTREALVAPKSSVVFSHLTDLQLGNNASRR